MRTGQKIGGPVANPIREMINSNFRDGVIFECPHEKKAINTRFAALVLKNRNGYDYKTKLRGKTVTVYKPEADPYELHGPIKVEF